MNNRGQILQLPSTWYNLLDRHFSILSLPHFSHNYSLKLRQTSWSSVIAITTIRFACYHSFTSIPFLDVNASIINSKSSLTLTQNRLTSINITITLFMPPYTRQTCIPFSLVLRLRRIYSTDETFTSITNELMTYLHKRCHNDIFSHKISQAQRPSPETKHFYQNVLLPSLQTNLNAFHSY